jgi:hypothetical protein
LVRKKTKRNIEGYGITEITEKEEQINCRKLENIEKLTIWCRSKHN